MIFENTRSIILDLIEYGPESENLMDLGAEYSELDLIYYVNIRANWH